MYYSGNRYLTQEEMKVNAQYIYDYLSAKGWTKNAISGMLGNMETESTINPAIWENLNSNDSTKGFGLVQWTPSTKYTGWCTTNNLIYTEMDSNLKRILYEVENGLQWGNDSDGNKPPYTFQQFTKSTEDPYTLAMNFLWYYERPLVKNQPSRGTQAEKWFTFLKGKISKKKKSKVFLFIRKRRCFVE
jgi:hypothetical protein